MDPKEELRPYFSELAQHIKDWGRELGFQQVAITDIDLENYRQRVEAWLQSGYHGAMGYLARNLEKRLRPDQLIEGTQRVISARMDYLAPDTHPLKVLKQGANAYVSRYALGRDYHKVLRRRLARLAQRLNDHLSNDVDLADHPPRRAFVDSAPVLEKALAEKAGLGWIGKNTLLLNRQAGSWFFLGEIFLDLPLPVDSPLETKHTPAGGHPCGACRACINICPTKAIVAPGLLDARRCISYLTIENPGAIPQDLRRAIGNRIFGCDDCQLICPWNRYSKPSSEADFLPRNGLDCSPLLKLFQLNEEAFLALTEGSAMRRITFWQWLRNLAIGLGNAPYDAAIISALQTRRRQLGDIPQAALVAEHIDWAIAEQRQKAPDSTTPATC